MPWFGKAGGLLDSGALARIEILAETKFADKKFGLSAVYSYFEHLRTRAGALRKPNMGACSQESALPSRTGAHGSPLEFMKKLITAPDAIVLEA